MAGRERKRAERQKRKARTAERRERMAAASAERDRAAREKLEPLQEAERPVVVTIGAVVSALIALVFWVSTVLAATGHVTSVGGEPSPIAAGVLAAVLTAMAWGMWRARYWAVLGFQAFLVIALLAATLGLIQVEAWPQAVGTVLVIAAAGTLFYLMIKAMARIQMPERKPPD